MTGRWIFAFAGLWLISGQSPANSIAVGGLPKTGPQLQISLHPVIPLKDLQPEVVVRYHNTGTESFSLNLPFVGPAPIRIRKALGRKDLTVDETLHFRNVAVEVDGRAAEWREKLHPALEGHAALTRWEKIPPEKHVDLKLLLNNIYKIPKDWRTINIKTSMIYGIEAEVLGNLKLHRIRHRFLDPIHITAAPVLPMNFNDPRIDVRFQNIGKKVFQLPLPKTGAETKMFWSVAAKIDRKKVRSFGTHSPIGGYKKWTRFVPLEAGESTEFTIRLKDYFKIPIDWKLIEIAADSFSLPKKGVERGMNPEFQDTLTLTRPLKRPGNVPREVWNRSDDVVRWFLYHQQERLEKLKLKSKATRKQ